MNPKTRTTALSIATAAVLAVLAGSPLLAEGMNLAIDRDQSPRVVAQFLQLTEAQRGEWRAIRQAAHAAIRPLADELAAAEEELQRLLTADAPDPTAIGDTLLDIRSLRQEVQAITEQAVGDFEALLEPEQAARLAAVRGAAPLCGIVPAFRALHLL